MKRLYLLRHAESGWDNPGQDDFDRPLTRRGLKSASLMGRHMNNLGYAPSIAMCSPARRTRETWDLVRNALAGETAEEMRRDLYHPDPQTLLDAVREIADTHPGAIVISHNPGILALALGLVGKGVGSTVPFGEYPAGALTVFEFAVERWSHVDPGRGRVIDFIRPGDLDSAA